MFKNILKQQNGILKSKKCISSVVVTSILDERCLVLIKENLFSVVKNASGYHPGPVTPSTSDGAPFVLEVDRNKQPISRYGLVVRVLTC